MNHSYVIYTTRFAQGFWKFAQKSAIRGKKSENSTRYPSRAFPFSRACVRKLDRSAAHFWQVSLPTNTADTVHSKNTVEMLVVIEYRYHDG